MPAAIGHPLVIRLDAPNQPVELQLGKPTLSVVRRSRDILVAIEPFPSGERLLLPVEESPQRIRLVRFDKTHKEIARILGEKGLRIPKSAKARLLEGLAAITPMLTVHSDIDGGGDTAEAVLPMRIRICT